MKRVREYYVFSVANKEIGRTKSTWLGSKVTPEDRMVRENCPKKSVSEPKGRRASATASTQCGYK